jgi:hypothetical protein
MAMPIDYTLPLFDLVQNYFLNVTLIAARECFEPLLNDYKIESSSQATTTLVTVTGTYTEIPLHITLSIKPSDKHNYYCVGAVVTWDNDPNHAPFDISFQCHITHHPIKYFDSIRTSLVTALLTKET